MKREFTAATKKAKAADKALPAPSKRKKRSHEESTSNTKVTLTVGGVTISVDQQTAASITSAVSATTPAAKKAKTTNQDKPAATVKKAKGDTATSKTKKAPDSSANQKAADNKVDKPSQKSAKAKQEKDKTKVSTGSKKVDNKASTKTDQLAKPKTTSNARAEAATAKPGTQSNTEESVNEASSQRPPRTKQTARRSKAFAALPRGRAGASSGPQHGVDSPGPQQIYGKTPDYWHELDGSTPFVKQDLDRIIDRSLNGTYNLYLRSHSPANVPDVSGPPRIALHHDVPNDKLWGAFTIGAKMGVLRIDDFGPLDLGANPVVHFGWRVRDMITGQMRFGRGCDGMMEVGMHGLSKGTFYRLFDGLDVDFGVSDFVRDTRMEWPEWMDQWESFVKEAYGH